MASLLTLWFCVYLEGFTIILTSWAILPFVLHFYFPYLTFTLSYLHSLTSFLFKKVFFTTITILYKFNTELLR